MADERLLDEEHYFRTRDTQLSEQAERRGISRRALLAGAAAAAVAAPFARPGDGWAAEPVAVSPPPARLRPARS